MEEQKRVFLLIGIMLMAIAIVGITVFAFLYHAAMKEERGRLTEAVESQARLIRREGCGAGGEREPFSPHD